MKTKFIIAAVLFVFVSTSSISLPAAQNREQHRGRHRGGTGELYTIKGRVMDWESNNVDKAIVMIPELGLSVETDRSGIFEFTQLPAGRFHIEVFAEGYLEYASDPFDLDRNRTRHDIVLSKKLMEEIVVTATRTPKLYAETPVRTEVISSRDIELKAATNLAEALYQTSGVRVENDCQNCNFTQVRINGMEGKYSQILIDSSPVVSALSSVYGLEQIPTEMLDRIEIVKGGGSALYGGNAIAGVINVITKEPVENRTILNLHQEAISGEPMTNLGFHSSFVSNNLNTKAILFASYQNRNPVDINGDDFSELGTISNTSFGFNLYNYIPGLDGNLKLSFFRIFEERRGGDLFERPPHEANTAEWAKTDQIGISSEWNHYVSEHVHYILSLSLVDTGRDSYYGSHKDPDAYGLTKNSLMFVNGQVNFQTGNHVLSFGVQHKRDGIKDEALGYGRSIKDTFHESGFFIQDDFNVAKGCSILTGLRLNTHSALERIIFTPRLSVIVKLLRDLSFRTSFSTGFRAPQVFDEDLHITQIGGEGMLVNNSPDLKEERSLSFSGGLDYGRQTGSNLIQCSVEGFYNMLFNTFILHEIDRTANARILERINSSGSKVYGVSLDMGLVLGPVFSMASGWTFQRSRLDEPEPEFGSLEFFRTPDIYGFASMSFKTPLFNVELSAEYTGRMKAPHYEGFIAEDRLETTTPFCVVNLKFHKRFNFAENSSVSVFIGGFNLMNAYQSDLDMGADRDSGYVYGPAKPRSFYAGFEIRL